MIFRDLIVDLGCINFIIIINNNIFYNCLIMLIVRVVFNYKKNINWKILILNYIIMFIIFEINYF